MTVATDRLPGWTLAVPILALATDLTLEGSATIAAGIALGVALLAAVLAAVHHAEVVAVRVGDPFGAVILALAQALGESLLFKGKDFSQTDVSPALQT